MQSCCSTPEYTGAVVSPRTPYMSELFELLTRTVGVALKYVLFYIYPVSILYKSIAGRYRPVRLADGPITDRYRFIKNASWVYAFVLYMYASGTVLRD